MTGRAASLSAIVMCSNVHVLLHNNSFVGKKTQKIQFAFRQLRPSGLVLVIPSSVAPSNGFMLARAFVSGLALFVWVSQTSSSSALTIDSARVRHVARHGRSGNSCSFVAARPAYTVTCPSGLTANPVATVVTSYLHTPAKRTTDVYLQRMQTFFQLKASIVAYVDFAYVRTAQSMVLHPRDAIIVPVTFAQFRTLACGLNVWQHEHEMDVEQERHAPTLYPVWAEKATMVVEAARSNCFGSGLFIWLDVGYFSEISVPAVPFPTNIGTRSVEPGKMLFLAVDVPSIERIIHNHFAPNKTLISGIGHSDNVVTLGGGGFAGDVVAVVAWEQAYLHMLDRYRARGWFAGKDQNLFASVCIETPHLCTLHDSKFQWYDMVPILMGTMSVKHWQPAVVGRMMNV